MACSAATTYRAPSAPFPNSARNQRNFFLNEISLAMHFLRAPVGAGRGPCLWRTEASPGALVGLLLPLSSPRAARDTRARASSELQQAPRPAGAKVAYHKVTVHDRQRGVTHEFVVPEVPPAFATVSLSLPLIAMDLLNGGEGRRTSTFCTPPRRRTSACRSRAATVCCTSLLCHQLVACTTSDFNRSYDTTEYRETQPTLNFQLACARLSYCLLSMEHHALDLDYCF